MSSEDFMSLLLDPQMAPLTTLVSQWALDDPELIVAQLPVEAAAAVYHRALTCNRVEDVLSGEEVKQLRGGRTMSEECRLSVAQKLCAAVLSSYEGEAGPTFSPPPAAAGCVAQRAAVLAARDGEADVLQCGAALPAFLSYYDHVQQTCPMREQYLVEQQRLVQRRLLESLEGTT